MNPESNLNETPGLGRRAEGHVHRRTPLKRKARVETGVCRGIVSLRSKKLQTPKKTQGASTVYKMQLRVPVPAVDGLLPEGSSLVIKSNPLYSGSQQGAVLNNSKPNSERFAPCDGARNPMFYGQRRKIRKTKEQEMISTILDLVECDEKKRSKVISIARKAKTAFGKKIGKKSSRLQISQAKLSEKKGTSFYTNNKDPTEYF